jgi:DNA-binding NtrC family response regulator
MNVLLLARKDDLEPSISETLQRAGHNVQFPGSKQEALFLIHQRSFDCVVLFYSLSNDTIEELSELLKQACPTCPIVAVSQNGHMDFKLQPATMVQWRQGAEALLATLSMIERRSGAGEQHRDIEGASGRQRRYSDKRWRAER